MRASTGRRLSELSRWSVPPVCLIVLRYLRARSGNLTNDQFLVPKGAAPRWTRGLPPRPLSKIHRELHEGLPPCPLGGCPLRELDIGQIPRLFVALRPALKRARPQTPLQAPVPECATI